MTGYHRWCMTGYWLSFWRVSDRRLCHLYSPRPMTGLWCTGLSREVKTSHTRKTTADDKAGKGVWRWTSTCIPALGTRSVFLLGWALPLGLLTNVLLALSYTRVLMQQLTPGKQKLWMTNVMVAVDTERGRYLWHSISANRYVCTSIFFILFYKRFIILV